MTRSALLTGGTGYIGGRLAARLAHEGWAVHILVRDGSDPSGLPAAAELHPYDGGIESVNRAVHAARPDVVFHLASLYLADHRPDQVEPLVASNLLLPVQLAEAMTIGGATRLINTGTASQHFAGAVYDPVSLYAATKQAAADMLRYFHEARRLSIITLKPYDTYGPGDPRRKVLQLLIDTALSGEPLSMSPGEQVLNLLHVDDAVEAFVVAAERLMLAPQPLHEEYLLEGQRISVRELAALVGEVVGSPVNAQFGGRPYRDREIMFPVEPLPHQRVHGWSRQVDLVEGIRELIAGSKAE